MGSFLKSTSDFSLFMIDHPLNPLMHVLQAVPDKVERMQDSGEYGRKKRKRSAKHHKLFMIATPQLLVLSNQGTTEAVKVSSSMSPTIDEVTRPLLGLQQNPNLRKVQVQLPKRPQRLKPQREKVSRAASMVKLGQDLPKRDMIVDP